MKVDALKKRLKSDRPMASVTIRIPEDVIEDLKELAPELGFSGYQPLIRAYIGQGMRKDVKRLESSKVDTLVTCLKKHGVSEKVLKDALKEAQG